MSHTLGTLFDQLGLPSDSASIRSFIHEHRPLPPDVALTEASWWTPAQASFLREALEEDAEWAPVVEELDTLLH